MRRLPLQARRPSPRTPSQSARSWRSLWLPSRPWQGAGVPRRARPCAAVHPASNSTLVRRWVGANDMSIETRQQDKRTQTRARHAASPWEVLLGRTHLSHADSEHTSSFARYSHLLEPLAHQQSPTQSMSRFSCRTTSDGFPLNWPCPQEVAVRSGSRSKTKSLFHCRSWRPCRRQLLRPMQLLLDL